MKKSNLKEIFDRNSVPENVIYELEDTNVGDVLGIEETIQGWTVYYSEHGQKFILDTFPSEDAACRDFLNKVGQRMREDYGIDITL